MLKSGAPRPMTLCLVRESANLDPAARREAPVGERRGKRAR
jgi:hypothetical protein